MTEAGRRVTRRSIAVNRLARLEGHGSLQVTVRHGRVTDSQFRLVEPPRFFEGLLQGRRFTEAPDITARICGICPVAHQMSACQAMEDAVGIRVDQRVRALRRLLYCGEWIKSHALHIYLLHAPDFLGYQDSLALARDHPDVVRRGLELKKIGNQLVSLVGGREIHPINVRVGGFYRAPARRDVAALLPRLEAALPAARETVRWVSGFDFPDLEMERELVALWNPDEYPMNEGRIASSRGLDLSLPDFEQTFTETQLPHTTALHSRIKGTGLYLTGPLARYALNGRQLSPLAAEAAQHAGLDDCCLNPFKSIMVRAVEMLHAFEEAIRIAATYQPPEPAFTAAEPREATGYGCSEAPRGLLYHRYRIDGNGDIEEAKIVPPTAQNQSAIEDDLRRLVEGTLDLDRAAMTRQCEHLIRSYDPCISCATHFLTLECDRG